MTRTHVLVLIAIQITSTLMVIHAINTRPTPQPIPPAPQTVVQYVTDPAVCRFALHNKEP